MAFTQLAQALAVPIGTVFTAPFNMAGANSIYINATVLNIGTGTVKGYLQLCNNLENWSYLDSTGTLSPTLPGTEVFSSTVAGALAAAVGNNVAAGGTTYAYSIASQWARIVLVGSVQASVLAIGVNTQLT